MTFLVNFSMIYNATIFSKKRYFYFQPVLFISFSSHAVLLNWEHKIQYTKSNLMIYNLSVLKKSISVVCCFRFFLSHLIKFPFCLIFRSWSVSKNWSENRRPFEKYLIWPCLQKEFSTVTTIYGVITFYMTCISFSLHFEAMFFYGIHGI